MAKKALPGEEIWKNTMEGPLYYFTTDQNHKRTTRSVRGNQTFIISAHDRELNSDQVSREERDPFRNGRLKRVDDRVAPAGTEPAEAEAEGKTALPEGHQADQALERDELVKLFEKNGMAFQTAVKKLDERNVRALVALGESEEVDPSQKQAEFLTKYVAENFRQGGATSTGREILEERGGR